MNLRTLAAESPSKVVKILAFGDSITAGLKLPPDEAFPSVLQNLLRDKKIPAEVINAGISGDTTTQGLQRVDWVLQHNKGVNVVLLELGANDGLRGLSIETLEENLVKLITHFKKFGINEIVLFGMRTTRNFSTQYQQNFERAFPKIAKQQKISYLPFLLEKVSFNPELTLPDLLHPNKEGHALLAAEILTFLESSGILGRIKHLNN